MEQGAVFKSNGSQAIRLPKAAAKPDDVKHVDVVAIGRTRIIAPAGEAYDNLFDSPGVSADFMSEQEQSQEKAREMF